MTYQIGCERAEELLDSYIKRHKDCAGDDSFRDGFLAAIAIVNAIPDQARDAHERLLNDNKEYADSFSGTSMPKGKVFSVLLESVDQYATTELFSNLYNPAKPLVAGCSVLRIDFSDQVGKYQACIAAIKELVDKVPTH